MKRIIWRNVVVLVVPILMVASLTTNRTLGSIFALMWGIYTGMSGLSILDKKAAS